MDLFTPGTGRRQLQKKRSVADGMIDPDRDLYAIPSQDGGEIYFLSLVDILTHYGEHCLEPLLVTRISCSVLLLITPCL